MPAAQCTWPLPLCGSAGPQPTCPSISDPGCSPEDASPDTNCHTWDWCGLRAGRTTTIALSVTGLALIFVELVVYVVFVGVAARWLDSQPYERNRMANIALRTQVGGWWGCQLHLQYLLANIHLLGRPGGQQGRPPAAQISLARCRPLDGQNAARPARAGPHPHRGGFLLHALHYSVLVRRSRCEAAAERCAFLTPRAPVRRIMRTRSSRAHCHPSPSHCSFPPGALSMPHWLALPAPSFSPLTCRAATASSWQAWGSRELELPAGRHLSCAGRWQPRRSRCTHSAA